MFLLKGTRFFIFTCLVIGIASCRSHKQSVLTKKYAPGQLRADAVVLKQVVLKMHPVIGLYESRVAYEKKFDDFIAALNDSLTEKEFRIRLKLLADGFHCGHTEIMASRRTYKEIGKLKQNYSPFIFLPVGEKVYVLANVNKRQDSILKKGAEVLKINGVPADSMVRYCKRFITSDGFNSSSKEHYVQLGFNAYYLNLFGRPDTFQVEFKTEAGSRTKQYQAFKPKSIPPLPLGAKDDSLYTRYKKAAMRFRYLDKDKTTLVLNVRKFSHRKDAKAYRKIFRSMKKNHTQNLVLDLRNNGGGSLANSYRLLSYLLRDQAPQTLKTGIKQYPYKKYTHGNVWFKFTKLVYTFIGVRKTLNDTDYFTYMIKPRKKNHFDGRVLVLINGGSFSASCLVAAYLQKDKRAEFVGEETGGTLEGCNAGITPYYTLPNTGIKARIPAFRIMHDGMEGIRGRGIMPDYPVKYGIQEILQRKDLEMMRVGELLKIQ